MQRFAAAVADAAARLPAARLRTVAQHIERRWPADAIAWGAADETAFISAMINAQVAEQLTAPVAAAYLRGVVDGYEHGTARQTVDLVFSGPASAAAPVRTTAQVLVDLIGEATRELLLVTYSARAYPPVIAALRSALARGVDVVDVVVETLAGAGSALSGQEPAAAFVEVPGVRLWHWPADARPSPGAKMHAKLAVADRRVLFASSVNLTQSGVEHSLEAGVIVRGGAAPDRAVDHIRHLQSRAGDPKRAGNVDKTTVGLC